MMQGIKILFFKWKNKIIDKFIMLCYNTFEIKGRKKKINYKGENYGLNKRRNKKSNYWIRR